MPLMSEALVNVRKPVPRVLNADCCLWKIIRIVRYASYSPLIKSTSSYYFTDRGHYPRLAKFCFCSPFSWRLLWVDRKFICFQKWLALPLYVADIGRVVSYTLPWTKTDTLMKVYMVGHPRQHANFAMII